MTMDWTDLKLIGAVIAGAIVAFLLSTATTIKARLVSVTCGVIFAVLLTGPVITWAELEFSTWQYAVAGLLAMTGDRIARRIMNLVDTATPPWIGGPKP